MSAARPAAPAFRDHAAGTSLAGVVAFFAVVIAVDAAFMVLALRTFPGQVVGDALRGRPALQPPASPSSRRRTRLGWRAAAAAEPGAVVAGVPRPRRRARCAGLTVTRPPASARPPRPAASRLSFAEAAPGRYVAPTGPLAGAWDLTAEAARRRGRRVRRPSGG